MFSQSVAPLAGLVRGEDILVERRKAEEEEVFIQWLVKLEVTGDGLH